MEYYSAIKRNVFESVLEPIIQSEISQKEKDKYRMLLLLSCFNHVQLCATPHMAAHQAPLSLGFSRQEYWNGLPLPSPRHACMLSRFSHVRLCATPWTAAHQDPLSTGFSRQEYWSGLPFPPPKYPILTHIYGI